MRIKVPITGTVIQKEPVIIGDPTDPIRPVRLPPGMTDPSMSWELVSMKHLDLDNEEMEIEVTMKIEDVTERDIALQLYSTRVSQIERKPRLKHKLAL